MNAPKETRYASPLRDEQAQATRDRILDAVRTLFEADPDSALGFDEIAATAGVARRTVFRHFADKEALLDAFWARTNQSMGVRFWPENERDLVTMPPDLFEALEGIAGIVRASHASAAGRAMRMRANPERQAAFRASLAQVTATLDPVRARQLEALVQLLFSATAWQSMKDYWGLDGRAAGEAVAWAIATLLDAVRPPPDTDPKGDEK